MKPVDQLKRHERGDCLRACIASLLELPAEEVPDFAEWADKPDVDGWKAWWLELQTWLRNRGLFFLEMSLQRSMPWMPLPYQSYCILTGKTESGAAHAVVGLCGQGVTEQFEMIHDPFHHSGGITSVEGICFLIPMNPAQPTIAPPPKSESTIIGLDGRPIQ